MDKIETPIKRRKVEFSVKENTNYGTDWRVNKSSESSEQSLVTGNEIDKNTFFLDTIRKDLLDFDFENICSVTLADVNVYCCLVCGKFFQGRTKSSPAYVHALQENHRIFIHLTSQKAYILPDNFEITSKASQKTINEIQQMIDPKFTADEIKNLKDNIIIAHDINDNPFKVGYVGLEKSSSTSYINVALQMIAHVPPIRDFYLSSTLTENVDIGSKIGSTKLNKEYSLLVRKIWSNHLSKSHISPHKLLSVINALSKNKFGTSNASSPKSFLMWFLNFLHAELSKTKKSNRSIFSETFCGTILMTSIPLQSQENLESKTMDYKINEEEASQKTIPFWLLSVSLDESILNRSKDFSEIPEVSLLELLQKYDGKKRTQYSSKELRVYQLKEPLPPYLIIHIDKKYASEEVNIGSTSTVVKFPKVLDLSPYILGGGNTTMNFRLISTIKAKISNGNPAWSINLCQDIKSDQWVNLKDSNVNPCEGELMFLDDNHLQIWEKIV